MHSYILLHPHSVAYTHEAASEVKALAISLREGPLEVTGARGTASGWRVGLRSAAGQSQTLEIERRGRKLAVSVESFE